MKKWFKGIFFNRYFLLFMMLFAYVQSIYIRITSRVEINAYTFTPEAVLFSLFQAGILFVIMLYFIKKFQKLDVFSAKEMLLIFGLSLVMFLLVMKASGLLLAFAFGTFERNFNQSTFFFTMLSDFLNGIIYGSFFLLIIILIKPKIIKINSQTIIRHFQKVKFTN